MRQAYELNFIETPQFEELIIARKNGTSLDDSYLSQYPNCISREITAIAIRPNAPLMSRRSQFHIVASTSLISPVGGSEGEPLHSI